MIALGYYMATEMFGTFKQLTLSMTSPFIILFLTVVGAYLFFRSTVSLILNQLNILNMAMSLLQMSYSPLQLCIE